MTPRPLFMVPRRKTNGWSKAPEAKTGRVRMMISLSPEDAERLDRLAGPYSPTSWATAKLLEALDREEG